MSNMTIQQKNRLDVMCLTIKGYIDIMYPKGINYKELDTVIMDIINGQFKPMTATLEKYEKEYIVNYIKSIVRILFGTSHGVSLDNDRSWFTDNTELSTSYFDRYKRHLQIEKRFNEDTLNDFSCNVLNPIMNQLGNPATNEFGKHGLVMGDVQSGKTMTYIGLINKAVDAGYKLIIVLTGTIEGLRKQTQERMEYGFTGYDSDSAQEKKTKYVGVGLDILNKQPMSHAVSFTTKLEDFSSKLANSIALSLDQVKGPAIMVIKKNVKILDRIYDWLKDNHGVNEDNLIKHSLLMLDDEADNASINTKDEDSDPTKTNAGIRKILSLFKKYSYVGFTATPFANIFINPDVYKKGLGKDLFPSDFIYSLVPPKTYIGGKNIFLEDSEYNNALIKNDDCEEVLPPSCKKFKPFTKLPDTLKDSLIMFTLVNVIRDLRGDNNAHRAMLVNISRAIKMHSVIGDLVTSYFSTIRAAYFNYAKMPDGNNEIMNRAKLLFEREYSKTNLKWDDVKNKLHDSNEKVEIRIVNSENDMVNYHEYPNGARIIFVGGLSLSRGLTLEGLAISYFCRNTKTYDALFQMGRWFGYRPNYEDLFRIYMPKELIGWYSTVTEAIEELKMDLARMRVANKRPDEFGLRVRNDKSILKITAANKMKSSDIGYKTVIGFGEVIPTPCIYSDVEKNIENISITAKTLKEMLDAENVTFYRDEVTNNMCVKNIPLEYVLKIIKECKFSPANDLFEKGSILSFIENESFKDKYFSKWDIVIVEGDKKIDNNLYEIPEIGLSIHKSKKRFDTTYNYIRMQGPREQLHNPTDTVTGLDQKTVDSIIASFKRIFERVHVDDGKKWTSAYVPAKQYLSVKNRNPLLMLYFIELSDVKMEDKDKEIKDKFDEANVPPFGIALGIPRYEDTLTSKTLYRINVVEQRKQREKEGLFVEEDEEIVEEI